MSFSSRSLLSLARSALRLLVRSADQDRPASGTNPARPGSTTKPARPARPAAGKPAVKPASGKPAQGAPSSSPGTYAGDFTGRVRPVYAPQPGGTPDPGEIVWAWVPYEDDHSQGKDRPVLLIGRSGPLLLALMLTTRDRNNGQSSDPDYVDVGTGSWDSRGRPSEVKVDRVLQLDPAAIRRQGAVLPRAAFEAVARRLAERR